MSELEGWLVVVDLQHVFGDEDSPWTAPRFDACAGSCDEDHDRALRVMSLYAPLVELATTDEVLARR